MSKKSDQGTKSAWKGFSSQILYIANRILQDKKHYFYYPEDIEDLIIKDSDNNIIESVQIKNISSDLTLSSLASSKSSKNEEGFYKRAVMLYREYSSLKKLKIVYFNGLGGEFKNLSTNKKSIINKL